MISLRAPQSNPHGVGRANSDDVGAIGSVNSARTNEKAAGASLLYWESPNNVNPGLVWHQPHVVYMSELEYRAAPNASAKLEVLHRMADVVLNTTAFIADFPEKRLSTGTRGEYYDLVLH